MSISTLSLPVGYSIRSYEGEFLLINPDGGQLGWTYPSIDAAIVKAHENVEFVAAMNARRELLSRPETWDWYESYDPITKECTLAYINDDDSREIVVYFEGHEYAGSHHDIARFKAAGFDEAIDLDNAFLYR